MPARGLPGMIILSPPPRHAANRINMDELRIGFAKQFVPPTIHATPKAEREKETHEREKSENSDGQIR